VPVDRSYLTHQTGGPRGTVTREPVGTRPDQEVGPGIPREAEEIVDVVLAVADVDAAGWITEQFHSPPHVDQLADTFLVISRDPRRVDVFLEGTGSLELLAGLQRFALNLDRFGA
jgi:hypothetical protein